jgi:hypothetical protein
MVETRTKAQLLIKNFKISLGLGNFFYSLIDYSGDSDCYRKQAYPQASKNSGL